MVSGLSLSSHVVFPHDPNSGTATRGPAFGLWIFTNIIYSLYASGWVRHLACAFLF